MRLNRPLERVEFITYKDRNDFEKNKRVVIQFPPFSSSSFPGMNTYNSYKIEVDTDGKLICKGRASLLNLKKEGDPLKKAVIAIAKILYIFQEKIAQLLDKPEQRTINLDNLKTTFNERAKFAFGLKNIIDHYNNYYNSNKRHDGLPELNTVYFREENALLRQRKELSQEFPSIQWEKCPEPEQPPVDRVKASSDLLTYFKAYCSEVFCPDLSFDEVKRLIHEGHSLFTSILTNPLCSPSRDHKSSTRNLACLTWYLMYIAVLKRQAFEEGSFVIEFDSKLIKYMSTVFDWYQRLSSHFEERIYNGPSAYAQSIWGVDIFNGLMPANKRTILLQLIQPFEKDSKPLLFFKPENYSARVTPDTAYDLIMHGIDYSSVNMSREDDVPGKQKEHVPLNVTSAFEKIINALASSHNISLDPKQILKDASVWGIAYMNDFITTQMNEASRDSHIALIEEWENAVKANLPPNEDLSTTKRTGREVYISANDLELIKKGEFARPNF